MGRWKVKHGSVWHFLGLPCRRGDPDGLGLSRHARACHPKRLALIKIFIDILVGFVNQLRHYIFMVR